VQPETREFFFKPYRNIHGALIRLTDCHQRTLNNDRNMLGNDGHSVLKNAPTNPSVALNTDKTVERVSVGVGLHAVGYEKYK
jgi:hypothetical protein